MRNYVNCGDTVTFTADGDVESGQAVVFGNQLVVSVGVVLDGAEGQAATEGVFELPKDDETEFAAGAQLCWDVSEGLFIAPADAAEDDIVGCAFAYEAAAEAATTVKARLTPGAGVPALAANIDALTDLDTAVDNLNTWAAALATKLNADATENNALSDFPLTLDTDYDTDPQAA